MRNFAVIYMCDIDEVPDFNSMYELYDPCTILFFWRNKHMLCDFGTGNNNKLNWVLEDKQELIDIIETIYRGAKKGRGLVVSPKGRWLRAFPRFSNSKMSLLTDFLQIIPRDTGTKSPAPRWSPRLEKPDSPSDASGVAMRKGVMMVVYG